jgi:hypothetical protein
VLAWLNDAQEAGHVLHHSFCLSICYGALVTCARMEAGNIRAMALAKVLKRIGSLTYHLLRTLTMFL